MTTEYLEQVKNYINNAGTLSDNFGRFSKLYNMTTENSYGFLKNYDLRDKKVLTVAGSGDQRLNAYFLGAKSVTCFDINPLTKLHINLKDKALTTVNFEKFIKFFNVYSRKYGDYYYSLDYRIFDELKELLDNYTYSFYNYLINELVNYIDSDIYFDFLNDLNALEKMNIYLNPDNYEVLSKIMRDKEVNFIESNLDCLPEKLNNEKFDMILLSNISDYTHKMYEREDLVQYRIIINKLINNLNLYGTIQVGYIYSKYSKLDDVSEFRINSKREKIFPKDTFDTILVDSYQDSNLKDKVIIYQKIK